MTQEANSPAESEAANGIPSQSPPSKPRRLRRLLVHFVRLLVVACIFLLFGSCSVDRIIFQPPASSYRDGPWVMKIPMPDGVRISAVHLPNPDARYTLLCSHGNAEDIGRMMEFLEALRDHGFAVLAYDYRGYGTSEGRPSEDRCYQDAEAIYQHLVSRMHIAPDRIILYGRSLGGAMAIDTASRHPVAGLVVESTFTSAFRVVTRLPLAAIDKFRSIDRIGRVRCPILVIHGRQDEIIPFSHGPQLFEAAHPPRLSLWVDGAHHNDLVWTAGPSYWDKLAEMRELVQSRP